MSYKYGDRAEFGIIDDFDKNKNYGRDYEPERYRCIAICEEAVGDWYDKLQVMPSFNGGCYNQPQTGIARWGVTLIPPSSLDLLIDVMQSETRNDFMADALEIIDLLKEARAAEKYVILYDV